MDLYRLLKSKSAYVILMIIAAFMLLSVFMIENSIKVLKLENGQSNITGETSDAGDNSQNTNLGISYDGTALMKDHITLLDEFATMISSAILLLFTGIFTVLFVCGENNSGFIKNIVSCTKKRWYIILSKTVVMSVFVFIELIITLLMTGIGSSIFLDNFSLDISWKLFQYMGLQCLLHLAFAVIIIMVSVLTRNSAISMIISICLCSGLGSLIISYLSKLNINGNNVGAHLPDYLVTSNVQTLTSNPTSEISIRVILVFIIAMLVYNLISSLVMEKRDI
jgi:ABC-2 type transport system permease protein